MAARAAALAAPVARGSPRRVTAAPAAVRQAVVARAVDVKELIGGVPPEERIASARPGTFMAEADQRAAIASG